MGRASPKWVMALRGIGRYSPALPILAGSTGMSKGQQRVAAGRFTRTVYVIGLAFLILQFLGKIPYALVLFKRMATNPNVVNPVFATLSILVAVVVAWLLGGRCIAVVRNRDVLDAYVGGKLAAVRVLGLSLLTLGLVVTALVLASSFVVEGGGQILIAGMFGFTVPLGLAVFELSRLIGFEREALDED